MNRAEVTDINFVTPDNPNARAHNTLASLGPFAATLLLLGFVATQHLGNVNTINELQGSITHSESVANPPSATLTEYNQITAALQDTTNDLEDIQAALPEVVNWPDAIARISTKLPGINTFSPQITLRSLNVTSIVQSTPFDYGVRSNRVINTQAELSGTATDKNAVADAIIQFDQDPDMLYRFPGTTINNDHYDFSITVALLGDEPPADTSTDRGDP